MRRALDSRGAAPRVSRAPSFSLSFFASRYFGNILAPFIIVGCNNAGVAWWWGLMWPVIINFAFGVVCYYFLPKSPEDAAKKTPSGLAPVKEEGAAEVAADEMAPVTIAQALSIPSVPGYCIAFGFMKLINYVLFFWLPLFLQRHFDSDKANLISTLYDFGMMPGGIMPGGSMPGGGIIGGTITL